MTDIRSLERILLANLLWNKARIKFLAPFLLALYAMRTFNLSILANTFSSHAVAPGVPGVSIRAGNENNRHGCVQEAGMLFHFFSSLWLQKFR